MTEAVAAPDDAAAEAEPKKETRPLERTAFSDGGGLQLKTFNDMWQFAQAVDKAEWGPKGSTPHTNLIAVQMGAEVGLPPMQAIHGIAVINGRPSLWGNSLLGVCMRSPVFDHAAFSEKLEGEGDNMVATCTVARHGGQLTTRTFSVADAKAAGLWAGMGIEAGYKRAKSPWVKYPKRMLQNRARGFAVRDTFADVIMGLYDNSELPTADELMERIDLTATTAAAEKAAAERPKSRTETVAERAKKVADRKPTAKAAERIKTLEAQGEPEGVTTPEPAEKPVAAPTEAPTADQGHDAEDLRIAIADAYSGLPDKKTKTAARNMMPGVLEIADLAKFNDVAGLEDWLAKIKKLAEKAS